MEVKKASELTIEEIWDMYENGVRLIISDGTVAGTEKE